MNDRTENTALPVPIWATGHEESDGGILWTRDVDVDIEPLVRRDAPEVIKLHAYLNDTVVVRDGRVVVEREHPPKIYLGDQPMTAEQARRFASELVDLADRVDGAR